MKQFVISNKFTNRNISSFNQYLKDISTIDILTPEEELVLAEKASNGDKDAMNELVIRNLRFVVSVAKQYSSANNPLEDLVNEGNIGLLMASEKFKPEMGVKFISYAVWWIRKVIMEHLNKHTRMVRIPANRINSISKLDKQINTMEQSLAREVTIQEIIDTFGQELLDEQEKKNPNKNYYEKINEEYELLEQLNSYNMDSLDRDISGDEGNGTMLGDTMSDDSVFKSTDHELLVLDIKKGIAEALHLLQPREKQVITAIFGLDGKHPRTLNDIGEELGVTREMIRQIREKSLKKLRANPSLFELLN